MAIAAPGPRRTRRPWLGRVKRVPRRIPHSGPAESVALRLIILFKAVKAVTLFVIGLSLLFLIHKDLKEVAEKIAETLHFNVHRVFITRLLERLSDVKGRQVAWAAAGALGYSGVLAIEAIGLAKRRAWAAWLAVGIGSLLLPVELYEIVHKIAHGHPWVRMAVMFVVNVAIVVYLTIEARRGGHRHGAAPAAAGTST